MYHEIAQPYALLYNLIPGTQPGARVGIVDTFRRTSEHGTPPGEIDRRVRITMFTAGLELR